MNQYYKDGCSTFFSNVASEEVQCSLSECPDEAHFSTSESHYQLAAVGP